jgi:PST family polysaccharide transporter
LTLRTPVAFWLATRQGPVRVADIWRAIAPPASTAVAVAGAVLLVRRVEPDPTAVGIASVGTAALVVALLGLLAWPETRRELMALMSLPSRRPRPT